MRRSAEPRAAHVIAVAWIVATAAAAAGSGAGPVLEVLPPVVDQAALRITVRLRNRGRAPMADSDVIVRYGVAGVARGVSPTLAAGTVEATGVAIAPGATAEVGTFALPDGDRALSFEDITISLRAEPRAPGRFETAEASFPHRWRRWTATITSAQLLSLGTGCSVVLDNLPGTASRIGSVFRLVSGSRWNEVALELPRACAVVPAGLGGAASPPGELLVAGLASESHDAQPALSVRGGRLVIRIELGGRRSDEIRLVQAPGTAAVGRAAVVADVRPFAVEVILTPAVSGDGRRVSYGRLPAVSVSPISAVPSAPFAASGLPLEVAVGTCIRGPLERQLRRVFDLDEVRTAVEDAVAAAVAGHRIHFVRSVIGRGDAILVTYV